MRACSSGRSDQDADEDDEDSDSDSCSNHVCDDGQNSPGSACSYGE
jgi:hypothetical protein